jgi:hypothetical protein
LNIEIAGTGGQQPSHSVSLAEWVGGEWLEVEGSSIFATVSALEVFDDGGGDAIYAAGMLAERPDGMVARLGAEGWEIAGGQVAGRVDTLAAISLAGKRSLVAGGYFSAIGGEPAASLAQWDGQVWASLSGGVDGAVLAVTVFGASPRLVVAGEFLSAGGGLASNIAMWLEDAWHSPLVGGGLGIFSCLNGGLADLVVFDAGGGPSLYAGGCFFQAGGQQAYGVVRWNGAGWQPVGPGLPGFVEALEVFDDGEGESLIAGGIFGAGNVAKWTGETWTPVGGGLPGEVRDMMVFDDGNGETDRRGLR